MWYNNNRKRERKIPNTRKVKTMTQREVFSAAKKFNSDRHIANRRERKILDIEVLDVIQKKNNKYINHKIHRSHELANFIDLLQENCINVKFENITKIFCFEKFDVYVTYTSDYVHTKS